MLLTIMLAHKYNAALAAALRRVLLLPWLGPNSKTQVTVEHKKDDLLVVELRFGADLAKDHDRAHFGRRLTGNLGPGVPLEAISSSTSR